MHNAIQQFSSTNKANLQALSHVASAAFAGAEKLVELNLAASKASLVESFSHMRAVMDIKDAAQWQTLSKDFMQANSDQSAHYAQQVQAIVTTSSAELNKALEAQMAQTQKSMAQAMEGLFKNAPAGTEAVVAAFQKALNAGQNAMESVQSQAQKAVDVARSSFSETAQQTSDAVKKAAKPN